MQRVVVRDTDARSNDGAFGRGISAQLVCALVDGVASCDPAARSSLAVADSVVANSREAGISVLGSDATIERTNIQGTQARASDGLLGDGLLAMGYDAAAMVTVRDTRIDDSARAGVANFGATVSLQRVSVGCAAFALNAEELEGLSAAFVDSSETLCGCPEAVDSCKATSAGLEPPEPIDF
jgi:hypothetical protein